MSGERRDEWTGAGHPGGVDDPDQPDPAEQRSVPARAESRAAAQTGELPPVVARLVVEIRSDGSRTIARGALEDAVSGQDVAVAFEADSPAALLGKLTRSLVSLPAMLRPTQAALPQDEPPRPSVRALGRRLASGLRRRLKRRR